MGTNYYAVKNRPTTSVPIHIGKSSWGWRFLFEVQNDKWNDPPVVWSNYEEVREWLYKHTVEDKTYAIVDEYDRVVSFDEFFDMVEEKQSENNPDDFRYGIRNENGYRFDEHEFC